MKFTNKEKEDYRKSERRLQKEGRKINRKREERFIENKKEDIVDLS